VRRIAVGSQVRILERPELEVFLFSPDPRERPAPEQFEGAGRRTRVVGVHLATGEPLYALRGLPGRWREDWLRAA
jgi:hypothetical protein